MGRLWTLTAALVVLLVACAGPRQTVRQAPFGSPDGFEGLPERLAARAASLVGHRGSFQVNGTRYNPDCSGFVAAVYSAEGIPFERLLARVSPDETSGAAAAYQAAKAYGVVFGGGGVWPSPGDLVFFHDTYDRDRDGRADDPFTHLGVVEYVAGATVVFLHRGGKGVVRAAMNLEHPGQVLGPDGRRMNSHMRSRRPPIRAGQTLAGQLFAGYGRIDPSRLPPDLVAASAR